MSQLQLDPLVRSDILQMGMPEIRRVTIFDRPAIAAQNVFSLDPIAAGQALLSPNQLSPIQRRTLADRAAPEGGLLHSALSLATNPLFLLGILLTIKNPLPTARNLMKVKSRFSAYNRASAPLLRMFNPAWDSYRGTTIPSLLSDFALRTNNWSHRNMEEVAEAVMAWEKAKQRRFGPSAENILITAKLGGLDRDVARKVHRLKAVGKKDARRLSILTQTVNVPAIMKTIELDPHSRRIASAMRKLYDSQYTALTSDVRRLAKSLRSRAIGDLDRSFLEGFMDTRDIRLLTGKTAERMDEDKLVSILRQYFEPQPHYVPRYSIGSRDNFRNLEAIQRMGGKKGEAARRAIEEEVFQTFEGELVKQGIGPRTRRRIREATAPHAFNPSVHSRQLRKNMLDYYDPESLRKVRSQLLDPDLPEKKLKQLAAIRTTGQPGRRPLPFDLNSARLFEEYTARAARTYNLYLQDIPDYAIRHNREIAIRSIREGEPGPRSPLVKGMTFHDAFAAELDSIRSDALKRDFVDVWLPAAKGQLTPTQFNQRLFWSDVRQRFSAVLDGSGTAANPASFVGKTLQDTLGVKRYEKLRRTFDAVPKRNIGPALAGWLYTGALGANPGSALQNLAQTYLTTVQFLPGRFVMEGHQKAIRDLSRYVDLRMKGVGSEKAARSAFKKLIDLNQEIDPRFSRGLSVALDTAWAEVQPGLRGLPSKGQKAQAALMSMFSNSERFVRLTAAHGAEAFAKSSGLRDPQEIGDFVNRIVQATQFSAGVANTPRLYSNWPAPLRQFLTFPTRLATSLTSTSPYVGAREPGFLSGGLGRSLLYSTGLFEASRALFDADIDRMLLFGGLPAPSDTGPFAPLPIVPPVVGLGGALGMGVASGDFGELKYAITPFVPGGVAGSKAASLVPPVAEQLGLAHVDWDNPVNGLYPYYNQKGALVGMFTPQQLALRATGLDFTGTQREGEVLRYLTTQRDKIRQMRREFTESIFNSDFGKAERIDRQFQSLYPELGPLTADKADFRYLQQRMELTRIERTIQTLPPEIRPFFAQAVAAGFIGTRFENIFGLAPEYLGEPTDIRQQARPGLPQFSGGVPSPEEPISSASFSSFGSPSGFSGF